MYQRNCPDCDRIITYTLKSNWYAANKGKRRCKSCVAFERNKKFDYSGDKNPFYGRKHSAETKEFLSKMDKSRWQTPEFRQKMSEVTSGEKNPMFNRSFFDVWVEKYGKEEAENKLREYRHQCSTRYVGKTHPSFGKSPSHKCGAGWSGWYRGWYFRSLRELSYVILVLEPSGLPWLSGECLRIRYVDDQGKERTYAPDFLVGERLVVEVKPAKLQSTPSVIAKRKAAEEHCRQNGLEYQMVDPSLLPSVEILRLYIAGEIVFTNKWQKRFEQKYLPKVD